MKKTLLSLTMFVGITLLSAQTVQVGSGSYTTVHPGYDAAGRNEYPTGTPQLSGAAANKPCPTNDWWSAVIKENHASNLFNYPFTLKTTAQGLVVSYIPSGVIDDLLPVTIGLPSLNATQTTVSDFSDWTITMNWTSGTHQLEATTGIGMPFLYFEKSSTEPIQVTVTSGTVKVMDEILLITNAKNGADFAIYAPTGSAWISSSGTYTSTLNDKDYFSLAFLPMNSSDTEGKAEEFQKYAYVFPTNTTANYSYDETNAVMRTDFAVTTEVKEGTATAPIIGLLPHHWGDLTSDSPALLDDEYTAIRGTLKTMAATSFSVEKPFYGILPTLPAMGDQSLTYDAALMKEKVELLQYETIDDWTDSYNDGQLLNRLIQTARVAAETGDDAVLQSILATVQARIENWLSYQSGEVAFLFYYIDDWSTLVGYPAGHSQDSNLNDHHFHWGYLIHAAAFVEQYNPGWAEEWGDMVNLLVRDAASNNRDDEMFPYLRNFSPYAGHCWANGFATFPQGNDQESTSESMQFNSSLIHWGAITGNDEIRDLGIYLYTTEQSAVEEYWFDMYDRTFTSAQSYSVVSRIWGNDLDNGTFWTTDLAASYGIELYPIHGGSLYLSHNLDYVEKLWDEIKSNTGICNNEANDNLWHDIMWQYAAFIDPDEALEMYDSYPERSLKFGVSDAQTYHWLHSMKALGKLTTDVQADYPIATVFDRSGRLTYVVHNYNKEAITVSFTDGYEMTVPAQTMAYEQAGELQPEVKITSPSDNTKHLIGDEITIEATAADYTDSPITKVEFFVNGILLGSDTEAPYSYTWVGVEGTHLLSCIATNGNGVEGESKTVTIIVSDEVAEEYTSNEAQQGSFSTGYNAWFETIGTKVDVKFQLLDTDKEGVVAYLWQESPFTETMMTSVGDNAFETTLQNMEAGTALRLACKFAYAGGMSVTKYFDYEVGDDSSSGIPSTSLDTNLCYTVSNGVLQLALSTTDRVIIYNIQGECIYTDTVQRADVQLGKGFYIIVAGNSSYKVVI